MPIVCRTHNLDRELTLNLYRAPGEKNLPDDVCDELRGVGFEPSLLRRNPATHDVWILILDLLQNHGQHAATGATLLGIVALWLKQRKGRRIEIERHGLKVKAPSVRQLEKTLTALHNYDELTLTLNKGCLPQGVRKKKAVKKNPGKSA